MEHEVLAEVDGVVRGVAVAVGDAVQEGQLLLTLASSPEGEPGAGGGAERGARRARRQRTASARTCVRCASATRSGSTRRGRRRSRSGASAAGARRARTSPTCSTRARSSSTAPLLFAAQERRRTREELIARTPADGLVGGVGRVDGPAVRGDVLRLHRAGGHAGHAQPRQEGPPVRARRAPAAAGGAVRRGRRRAAGRRRHADRRGPGLPRFVLFAQPERPRAARRHRLRLLLRRQRRAARLLRRGDRHRGLEHRHGRAGDDRGRRARRARARRGRPDRRAGRQRRGRPARRPTTPRRSRCAKRYLSYFQRSAAQPTAAVRRPDAAARARSPSSASASTTCAGCVETLFDEGSVLELRGGFGPGMLTALARVDGRAAGRRRQRSDASRRRDRRRRRRQGRALPAAVRRVRAAACCSCATRPASWSARTPSRPRRCATSRACSSAAPT